MKRRTRWLTGFGAALLIVGAAFGYYCWEGRGHGAAPGLLNFMPPEATTVVYADLGALRDSPFLTELLALAPSPTTDRDYAKFVQETGFDYERDLDRAAVAVTSQGRERVVLAVADGRFDRGKIVAYALKSGKREIIGGREVFRTPISGSTKWMAFTFLSQDRLGLTDAPDLGAFARSLAPQRDNPANAPWRERFTRLAGSPVFLVSSLNAPSGGALVGEATPTFGLRSERLGELAAHLRWGTVALRPEGNSLRVVAEAECADEDRARQLSGVASGLSILAGAALADPKTRRQLDAETLAALDEMLKTVDISRIDRGEAKAVRVVFFVTSRVLKAVQRLTQPAPH